MHMSEYSGTRIKTQAKQKRRFFLRMPKGSDKLVYWSLILLAGFGLLMIASASMGIAVGNTSYLAFILAKQIVFLGGGYIAMVWLANHFTVDFLKSSLFPTWALGVAVSLLACLVFPKVNGARAWLRVPISRFDISIQPSEFAKIMVALIVAAYCGDVKKTFPKGEEIWKRPVIFILGYVFIVLVLQSDLGSAAVMLMIAWVCFYIPAHPQMRRFQKVLFWVMTFGIVIAVVILTPYGEGIIQYLPLKDYQIKRFLSAVNPFADQYNTGFQLISGLVSFATGGWRGLGFGNSVRKYTSFPAANTDIILAIVIEELGMIGFALIFIPYLIIVVQMFRYALKINSEKAKIILVGVAIYLIVHCLFNIGGVTGLIPLTGVPLLMISSGGSSAMSFMCAIGIAEAVISQYRRGEIQ